MIGTYNAMDAQRVFQFGVALGRRFAQVPVPAPDPVAFRAIVDERLDPVPQDIRAFAGDEIAALYEAHFADRRLALGPALFLEIPSYLAAAQGPKEELLAEAYLTSLGALLARFDEDDLDLLGNALKHNGTLGSEWDWVRQQLDALR